MSEPRRAGCIPFNFYIGDGELDGVTTEEAFELGVFWEMFRTSLLKGGSFGHLVHVSNRDRIVKMLNQMGRKFKFERVDDDVEGLMWFEVEAANNG